MLGAVLVLGDHEFLVVGPTGPVVGPDGEFLRGSTFPLPGGGPEEDWPLRRVVSTTTEESVPGFRRVEVLECGHTFRHLVGAATVPAPGHRPCRRCYREPELTE